ncbi:hypothetical protein GCM10007363_27520 [Pseudomonas fluvialis]|uniref:Uncharacterized protein n=1 Tax=Pseudomonas fluvialis TaxID=1793966 RepID=A0ABQ2ARY3_9PSED|nr:hypothetical protein GCM10007363_27520 [Pseudomonas fluvialis]
MGIGIELVGNVLVGVVAKQIQHGAGGPVGFECLQDVLRRMPLMDKQRYGGHADLLAFSFACPIEERLGQALEACHALAQAVKAFTIALPYLFFGKDAGLAFFGGFGDQVEQPFGKVALGVFIPAQFRCQAGVVAILLGGLSGVELLLHAYIWATGGLGVVLIGGVRVCAQTGIRGRLVVFRLWAMFGQYLVCQR